ncbi:hypothetical protein VDQ94_09105 [Xanthomonas campestris pv. campestris]|nr:hypothetical protein [Xanthomonas campestris pv. campestris]MEB1551998.1 hypothetical protein [Xanthomonas campestris pv. campestris]
MKHATLGTALLVLMLQGCQASTSTPAPAAPEPAAASTPQPAPAAPQVARPALPPEACQRTADGFAVFLEAIATDPALRAAYSAPKLAEYDFATPPKPVERAAEPFRLALIDSRWSYDEPDKNAEDLSRVDLKITQQGDQMRASFVRAEFSADDEVVKTLGAPEAYVFDYTKDCWQLSRHVR